MSASFIYIIVAIIIGGLFPIYVILEGSKVRKLLQDNPSKLLTVYWNVLICQLLLILIICLAFYLNGDSMDQIGLSFLRNPLNSIYLISIGLLFFWIMHTKTFSKKDLVSIKKKYDKLSYLIPKNLSEYKFAIMLSFMVGICEEIIYRGFLFWQMTLYLPLVLALLITNIVFGLLHWGTGMKNAIAAFVLGMIYSALSIYFDSLWGAILAHILTDVYSVSIGYKIYKLSARKIK